MNTSSLVEQAEDSTRQAAATIQPESFELGFRSDEVAVGEISDLRGTYGFGLTSRGLAFRLWGSACALYNRRTVFL